MSRNRKDVVTLFDVFCEVGATLDGGVAVILQKYPDDFNHEQTLKSVAQFSFPCGVDDYNVETVQLFSFVLTDEKSQYTYAFCRHTPHNNTCICILSGLPWTNVFYKILNHISAVMNNRPTNELDSFLTCAYHTPILGPGESLLIESNPGVNKLQVTVPDIGRLPTLKENKFMLEFYNAISEKQMIALYASLLKERRILFTSQKLGQLSSCIFAAAALLYPMHWQNLFIPVLPIGLIDMLMAPMPYLIGVPKKILQSVKQLELGDVMVIDLEERTLQCTHNDVLDLPAEALSILRHHLHSSSNMFFSDRLARSFLRTNVFLFGGYRKGLSCSSYSFSWDRQKFIQNQKPSLQTYLQSLLGQDGVQYLERFIDERIAALNSGTPIDDEFEKEIRVNEMKSLKASHLNHPEMFQNAVTSVRENANDVIGLLKDKVHSIALKERLGRLTPKEIRRVSSRKPHPFYDDGTLSFDTQQWMTEDKVVRDGETTSSSVVEETTDLIDLSDNLLLTSNDKANDSPRPSCTSGRAATASPAKLADTPPHHLSLQFLDFDPFASIPSITSSPPSPVNLSVPKDCWQRFD
uniref:UDENN domain-containing protein n=2 Tax=Wuchereria bancrofti TaxID=6293 RepID=A0AAF5RTC7_WUCBA